MSIIYLSVNLETLNLYTNRQPYEVAQLGAEFKFTRSTWFPGFLLENFKMKQGYVITNDPLATPSGNLKTVTDEEALYLYNNYTSGPYAFLTVTSFSSGYSVYFSFSSSSLSSSSKSSSSSSSSRSSSSSSS